MDFLLKVVLPLSLAFIMFSLGIGLTFGDFARVFKQPKAFFAGALSQIIMLPVVEFVLLQFFSLPPELAFGVMILSFCPGGVTSNILTKLAGGALALSISLTAVVSLVSVITVPVFAAWAAVTFMGTEAPDVNVTSLALSMFVLTAVPVVLGVLVRHFATGFADRVERTISTIATVLFVIIVLGAVAGSWGIFVENLFILGPLLILLNIGLLAIGYAVAQLLRLDLRERVAVAIETGVQNATLGITVGSLIAETASALPPFSLPSGVYGITMYFVTLPFIFWARSKTKLAD